MHQTWENDKKKTNFESDFGLFHPNSPPPPSPPFIFLAGFIFTSR